MPLRLGDAVLGATVADELGLGPGDALFSEVAELYDLSRPPALKMRITGVLAPTGTPNDRAIFINMEGFFLFPDHAKPVDNGHDHKHAHAHAHGEHEGHDHDHHHHHMGHHDHHHHAHGFHHH